MSPPDRPTRKNGIDILGRWRMKVKNSIDLIGAQGQQVDFGPFQAYDIGQSTNAALDDVMETDGDFVGIQLQANDARYPTADPFYWYSVSGFCPNLPWSCTFGAAPEDCYGQKPVHPTLRCEDEPCPGKGTVDNPNKKCLTYFGTGDVKKDLVKGGLCDENGGDPTGKHGCTYSYVRKDIQTIKVDELVGIYDQECKDRQGIRKCTDWLDFRKHCTNSTLKRKFGAGGVIERNVGFCVEYDVHPDCVNDCHNAACQAVTGEKELGLPFWQGRCDPKANRVRVEQTAKLFGIPDAETKHAIVFPDLLDKFAKCTGHQGDGVCQPDTSSGGPYCSRKWSGVCTTCYIPGTKHFYPANATQPTCPLEILLSEDYKDKNSPGCMTRNPDEGPKPRDLCCLYTLQCGDGFNIDDPDSYPTDDDGLAMAKYQAVSKQDSQPLIDFLTKVAHADPDNYGKYVNDTAGITNLVYWQWSLGMTQGESLDKLKAGMKDFFSNTSPAPTPAPTGPPSPGPAPGPGPSPDGPGGPSGAVIFILVLVVVGIIVAAIIYFVRRNNARARNVALLQQEGNARGGV
eukprot:TRINITY_DN1975_c0_g1_i4.p1 TRINITY_DN1975_c0_g1~~TRINITY_DN1975_c0_g1_i4.p1  ORF type:complete len:665 (+),score=169.60 TRINITY_DN1975_c0_g1_i4:288-1997(+)